MTDGGSSITWPCQAPACLTTIASGVQTHKLVWNAASTLGGVSGPVQIRTAFVGGGFSQTITVQYDANPTNATFAGGNTTQTVGPGTVDLQTGDYTVAAGDASLGGMSVDRSFDSQNPTAASGGVFGPGWSSSLNLGSYTQLTDGAVGTTVDWVSIASGDGSQLDFMLNGAGTSYTTTPSSTGYALKVPVSGDPCYASSAAWQLTDPSGLVTCFTQPSGAAAFYPSLVVPPNDGSSGPQTTAFVYSVVSGIVRPTEEVNALPGITCTGGSLDPTEAPRELWRLRFRAATVWRRENAGLCPDHGSTRPSCWSVACGWWRSRVVRSRMWPRIWGSAVRCCASVCARPRPIAANGRHSFRPVSGRSFGRCAVRMRSCGGPTRS